MRARNAQECYKMVATTNLLEGIMHVGAIICYMAYLLDTYVSFLQESLDKGHLSKNMSQSG